MNEYGSVLPNIQVTMPALQVTPTDAMLHVETATQATIVGVMLAFFIAGMMAWVRRFWSKQMRDVDTDDHERDMLDAFKRERDDQRFRADQFAAERMEAVEKVACLTQEVGHLRTQVNAQSEVIKRQELAISSMGETIEQLRGQMLTGAEELHKLQLELTTTLRELITERDKCLTCLASSRGALPTEDHL